MAGDLPETATADEKAEHAKLLTRLKRLNSPGDVAKAIREQDKLISSGTLKRALPKDAKPEDVAKWREENGIPAAPDKYDLGVPKDIELNELDNKMLAGFATRAHASNMTPDQVKAVTASFFETRLAVAEQMQAANETAKEATSEQLREEWGPDYKSNVDGVTSWLKSQESAVFDAFVNARTADGVQLLNHPEVMRALAKHSRELGYVGATVVPAGGDLGKTIDDEIASIEKTMFDEHGQKSKAYWNSDKAQARYSELLEAKARRAK
jgi:hypothetical protein